MSFADLFEKYKTAKPRAYGALYDALPTPTRVLELGVKAGGSLLAWAERWPDAEVYGADISFSPVRDEVFAHPRVHLMLLDATDPGAVPNLSFDLIIDDVGLTSHKLTDQVAILHNYAPCVRPGGVYVVEDITSDEGVRDLMDLAAARGFDAVTVLRPPGLEFRVLVLSRRPT